MDRIGVGSEYKELLGEGTEYLVIDGFVVAKFFDGELSINYSMGSKENTLIIEETEN